MAEMDHILCRSVYVQGEKVIFLKINFPHLTILCKPELAYRDKTHPTV